MVWRLAIRALNTTAASSRGGEANGQNQPGLGVGPCLGVGKRDRHAPNDLGRVIIDIDNLGLGKELLLLEAVDITGPAHQDVDVIVNRSAGDIRVRSQGLEDELDLAVGHVPERLGDDGALDGDHLFQLVL